MPCCRKILKKTANRTGTTVIWQTATSLLALGERRCTMLWRRSILQRLPSAVTAICIERRCARCANAECRLRICFPWQKKRRRNFQVCPIFMRKRAGFSFRQEDSGVLLLVLNRHSIFLHMKMTQDRPRAFLQSLPSPGASWQKFASLSARRKRRRRRSLPPCASTRSARKHSGSGGESGVSLAVRNCTSSSRIRLKHCAFWRVGRFLRERRSSLLMLLQSLQTFRVNICPRRHASPLGRCKIGKKWRMWRWRTLPL